MQYYTNTLTRTSTTDITIAVRATAIPTSIKRVYCSTCRGREIQLIIKHDIYLKTILSIFTWPTLRCTAIPYTTMQSGTPSLVNYPGESPHHSRRQPLTLQLFFCSRLYINDHCVCKSSLYISVRVRSVNEHPVV